MSGFLTNLAARSVSNLSPPVIPRSDPYLSLIPSPVLESNVENHKPDSTRSLSAVETLTSTMGSTDETVSGFSHTPTPASGSGDTGYPEVVPRSTDQQIQQSNPAKSGAAATNDNTEVRLAGSIESGSGHLTHSAASSKPLMPRESTPHQQVKADPRQKTASAGRSTVENTALESSPPSPQKFPNQITVPAYPVQNVKVDTSSQSTAGPRIQPAQQSPGGNHPAQQTNQPAGSQSVTPGPQPVPSPRIESPRASWSSPAPAASQSASADGSPPSSVDWSGSSSNQVDYSGARGVREPAPGSNPPRSLVEPASAGKTTHPALPTHSNSPAVRVHIGAIEVKATGKVPQPKAARTKPAGPPRSKGQGFEAYSHLRG